MANWIADLTDYLANNPLEFLGMATGLLAVYLNTRENPLGWPIGIISVGIYVFIFFEAFLIGDFLLHIFYVVMGFYGWYQWRYGNAEEKAPIPISYASARSMAYLFIAGALLSVLVGWGFSQYPEASLPYWDAFTTVFSLIAQYQLAKKHLENWLLWIVVDIVCVGVYYVKDLYITSVLYAIYTLLAIYGYQHWKLILSTRAQPQNF